MLTSQSFPSCSSLFLMSLLIPKMPFTRLSIFSTEKHPIDETLYSLCALLKEHIIKYGKYLVNALLTLFAHTNCTTFENYPFIATAHVTFTRPYDVDLTAPNQIVKWTRLLVSAIAAAFISCSPHRAAQRN